MSTPRRIAVYGSQGRSLAGALEAVQRYAPGARICAIVSAECPADAAVRARAHEIIESGAARYSLRAPGPLWRWAARLRHERFDEWIMLFDSPRLLLLAGAAHPGRAGYLRPNGTMARMPRSLALAAIMLLVRYLRGRCAYAIIWTALRVRGQNRKAPANVSPREHTGT